MSETYQQGQEMVKTQSELTYCNVGTDSEMVQFKVLSDGVSEENHIHGLFSNTFSCLRIYSIEWLNDK